MAELGENRENFRGKAKDKSLSVELLRGLFDAWQLIIESAKDVFAAHGQRQWPFRLSGATSSLDGGERVLTTAAHPFRLRWSGEYLAESQQLASNALAGELPLNQENNRLYLDWISALSPLLNNHLYQPMSKK